MAHIVFIPDESQCFDNAIRDVCASTMSLNSDYMVFSWTMLTPAMSAIERGKPQMLVIGCDKEGDDLFKDFAQKAKKYNSELKVVRLGSFLLEGPPREPYDIFVTEAGKGQGYKNSLLQVMQDFLSELKKKAAKVHS